MFAELPKAADKFHFPGHKKTDKYCQEACNPNKVLKDLNIKELNSPACEQASKWLNLIYCILRAKFRLKQLYCTLIVR